PHGCLLQPNRLSWRDVRKAMADPQKFAVVYQQEDEAQTNALVQKVWIDGGLGNDGKLYIGCSDKDRGIAEPPRGLTPPVYSIATADMSPTRYWAIQWWAYHPATNQRFLLDLIRQVMEAPDFLDWDHYSSSFVGV